MTVQDNKISQSNNLCICLFWSKQKRRENEKRLLTNNNICDILIPGGMGYEKNRTLPLGASVSLNLRLRLYRSGDRLAAGVPK